MSKFHLSIQQWGLVSGIRQLQSDMVVVHAPRSPFAPEARKGQLLVTVEAEGDASRGRQACELVARTISETFYADGSLSITASLRAALKAANAALYKHNFEAPPHKRALVGATCAVIHGADLFLTQVPPTQAFVAHNGKVRALPAPLSWTAGAEHAALSRGGALGTSLGSEPEFSRSLMQPGDTLVLCSTNVGRLLGKQQAEGLIGLSDGQTIAEELYNLCRSANLPEAQALVVEAVPGPAPDLRDAPFTPAAVADRSKQVVERWGTWIGRGSRRDTRQPVPAENATAVAEPPPAVAPAVAAPPAPVAPPMSLHDTLPIADLVPLPPSAFLGEGEYGGMVRPPAVPRRTREIDLSDNNGTPVDFAAIPRKPATAPPTIGERLTLPFRAAYVGMMSSAGNVPRRTARAAKSDPAAGLRLKGLSYRRQRPPLPWFNILLIVGIVALLIVVGLQQNRRRDLNTVDAALQQVSTAVTAARRAPDDQTAQRELARAAALLNDDVQELITTGLITETRSAVWSRYLGVRGSYDQAMASINRIGFVNDLETVASLPGEQGRVDRITLGITTNVTPTETLLFYLDREAGVLYQAGRDQPLLKPDDAIASINVGPVREVVWREVGNNIIAFDRGDQLFPIYRAFQWDGANWLANQLQGTELMGDADKNLPIASYGGNLYMWDQETQQIKKYSSGYFADLPVDWITDAGGASLDRIVDVQVAELVYLLRSDGTILVFEGGRKINEFAAPELAVPISGVSRFVVTPVQYAEDGSVAQPGHIYLLDLRAERILQLNKSDGSLVQQIQARTRGPLNQMVDLAVDEERRELYIANGPNVLRTKLPDPPQAAVEETATPEGAAGD